MDLMVNVSFRVRREKTLSAWRLNCLTERTCLELRALITHLCRPSV